MLTFTRLFARQFRSLLRKSVLTSTARVLPPPLLFTSDKEGVLLHCQGDGVALSAHLAVSFPPAPLALPLSILEMCEGNNDSLVEVHPREDSQVELRWQHGCLPQARLVETVPVDKVRPQPALPEHWQPCQEHFLVALDQAVQSSAKETLRYALTHLLLDADTGTLTATDGRQLLLQKGLLFPWKGQVLIPRLAVFGSREWAETGPVQLGKTDTHVVLHVGAWTLHLPLLKEGRFPTVANVVPPSDKITTTLRFAAEDAAFLAATLPQLPGRREENAPITVDLNGSVSVRAREPDQPKGTAVALARSTYTGTPVRFVLNRELLQRALSLGLHELQLVAADKALLAQDATRQFVVMPLPPKEAWAAHADDLQISSVDSSKTIPAPRVVPHVKASTSSSSRLRNVTMSHRNHGSSHGQTADLSPTPPKVCGYAAVLAEAQAVQTALRDALGRVNGLLGTLKQHRRQAKAVQSSLLALRELPSVDA